MVKQTEKPIAEIPNDSADWKKSLDMEKVKKSAEMNIKPTLKIETKESAEVIIMGYPRTINPKGNPFEVMDIVHNNVEKSINVSKSMKYNLAVLENRLESLGKQLLGTTVIIEAQLGDTKEYKNVKLYSISLPVNISQE